MISLEQYMADIFGLDDDRYLQNANSLICCSLYTEYGYLIKIKTMKEKKRLNYWKKNQNSKKFREYL